MVPASAVPAQEAGASRSQRLAHDREVLRVGPFAKSTPCRFGSGAPRSGGGGPALGQSAREELHLGAVDRLVGRSSTEGPRRRGHGGADGVRGAVISAADGEADGSPGAARPVGIRQPLQGPLVVAGTVGAEAEPGDGGG